MLVTKLSGFYFFYFALLGVMAPYLGLYLESKGFSLLEIAQLSSVLMVTKVLAPYLWGAIADHYQIRLKLVRFGALMTMFCYLGFFFVESFWHYALIIVLFSFFWNAILPQFEVITLFNLANYQDHYSRIRLWGSIGFIISVALMGWLFERVGIRYLPWVLLIIVIAIWASSFVNLAEPRATTSCRSVKSSFKEQFGRRDVKLFFIVSFLLHVSHGAYYTYFSIFLESIGYEKTHIGLLWSLGVLAEVALFIVMHHWFSRSSLKVIMMVALAFSGLRWCLIAEFSGVLWVLVLAQCFHAMSFGAMHAASIKFVHLTFDVRNQGKAQALYSSLGFGAGGAAGAYLSGLVVSQTSYDFAFWFSGGIAFLAMFLIATAANHFPFGHVLASSEIETKKKESHC